MNSQKIGISILKRYFAKHEWEGLWETIIFSSQMASLSVTSKSPKVSEGLGVKLAKNTDLVCGTWLE